MSCARKEIRKTLQGEGAHAGRSAALCRFSRCNPSCAASDIDGAGIGGIGSGGDETAGELVFAIDRAWQGGGPLLRNTARAVACCLTRPPRQLSLQTHKHLGNC